MSQIKDVGIIACEVYVPVIQTDLEEMEKFDNVSKGKYTLGLGQNKMSILSNFEDTTSMALSVVSSLMKKVDLALNCSDLNDIENYTNAKIHKGQAIGAIFVATESSTDKSKSIKSSLMSLFTCSNSPIYNYQNGDSQHIWTPNYFIEGCDFRHACYGGTAALFASFDWVHSPHWNGKYAIVVATDSCIYENNSASKATGGAGAFACLVGPNAPLILERRITYSDNTNDFYKPIPSSMFPIVNGKSSLHCYFKSLIECQYEFLKKEKGSIFDFDSILFHTPFTKITQKALARMEALDNKFMKNPQNINKQEIIDLSREAEKKFINNSKLYNLKTLPSTRLAKNVGNCNTASLYMSLYSYLDSIKCKPLVETVNKKILLYSYGSGLIASLFTLRFNSSEKIIQKLFSTFTPIEQLLSNKTCISSQEYTTLSKLLEKNYNDKQNFTFLQFYQFPYQNFYLSNIDSNFCRNYEYKY